MVGGNKRKGAKTTKSESTKSGFDMKQVTSGIETVVKSRWFTILLVLIPLLFALFFRLYPATLPITDNWAEDSIDRNIRAQAEQQIRSQYPLLPAQEVNAQTAIELAEFKETNQEQYEQQRDALSNQFKSRLQQTITKDDGSTYEQTYLLAIDPYYYLRRAENVAETGSVCDEVVDGQCIDNRMVAPNGAETSFDFHSMLGGLLILIFGMFGFASMTAVFYMPAIISSLSTIPAFFIVKRRYGSFAGLIAGLIVGLHTTFLGRTPAGFADTDAYNVFFPLYIAWLLLLGLDRKDKWGYLSIAGAGILTGLYSEFWGGWYFTFFILFLVLVGTAGYALIRWLLALKTSWLDVKIDSLKNYAARAGTDLGIYLLGTAIVTTILSGPRTFINAFLSPLNVSIGLKDPVGQNLWPNVLTTVAELNPVALPNFIGQAGGRILVILAIVGIFSYAFKDMDRDWKYWTAIGALVIYYFVMTGASALGLNVFMYLALFALPLAATFLFSLIRKENIAVHYGLFLMGWFVATMFATTQGARFLLLIVPIMGVAIGFAVGWIKQIVPALLNKEMKVPEFWGQAVVVVIIGLLILGPVGANMVERAHRVGLSEVPSMNDAWWNALNAIEDDSQPDAIITSWWDFGHWFKYVSDRRVTFDGASQRGEQAHLVGKLFQTSDEEQSLGILRMLNCGATNAFDLTYAQLEDPLASYQTMMATITQPRDEARETLIAAGISEDAADTILSESHCTPPESYVIVSEDMVGKAGVWGHFGLWSTERSFVYETSKNNNREQSISIIQEQIGISQAEASQLYTGVTSQPSRQAVNSWISPWPQLGGRSSCNRENETIICGIGMSLGQQQGVQLSARNLVINTSNVSSAYMQIVGAGQILGRIEPSTLLVDGERYEVGGDFPLAIAVEENRAMIADRQLVDSMFVQWFYDEEPGDYLEQLTKQTQVTGQKIVVYKVDWDAFTQALGE